MKNQIEEKVFKAIEDVIEYMYEDELKHFEENNNPTSHIFHAVKILQEFTKNY